MNGWLFVGTAGWAIPRAHAPNFPEGGSNLSRYASVFNAAEINSTFYRPHRPSTFERWRDSVPEDFRFSVKVPKEITHQRQLVGAGEAFATFAASLSSLGTRLGPLLLQLPPKFAFEPRSVEIFLKDAKDSVAADLVFEPRHASWFSAEAEALLTAFGAARAGADPERCPGALRPGGSRHLRYRRLHGSPRIYFSAYGDGTISELARLIQAEGSLAWCILDNTASGAAALDAIRLLRALTLGDGSGRGVPRG